MSLSVMKENAILITGGSGKIGSKLVDHFLSIGRTVVFTSRSEEKIRHIVAGRENLYGIAVDFRDKDAVAVIEKGLADQGLKVSAVVNNARDLDALKVGEDGTVAAEDFLAEYNIDVVIPYELAMRLSKTQPLRKIVNV